jgi:organic hydroperoxide reductase OsmC/OhrA
MSKHIFKLRLNASYASTDNDIASLEVQVLDNNEWTAFDLNPATPGFLIYVYSIFTCQHLYLRTNAAERNLVFDSSRGAILVEASEDWFLQKIDVQFEVSLASGSAGDESIEYITSRMQRCPVSKNLPENIDIHTSVVFNYG